MLAWFGVWDGWYCKNMRVTWRGGGVWQVCVWGGAGYIVFWVSGLTGLPAFPVSKWLQKQRGAWMLLSRRQKSLQKSPGLLVSLSILGRILILEKFCSICRSVSSITYFQDSSQSQEFEFHSYLIEFQDSIKKKDLPVLVAEEGLLISLSVFIYFILCT